MNKRFERMRSVVVLILAAISLATIGEAAPGDRKYRGLLGADSAKIKREGGKTRLWAGPRSEAPSSAKAQWYDFTGSSISAAELQFGIGKDSIRAIDDPLFVSPDDTRLLELPRSHYRKEKRPKTTDGIRVIGFSLGGASRAYPVALLDGHELVNDEFGGKPVTVGW